jgi:hypothetical protein
MARLFRWPAAKLAVTPDPGKAFRTNFFLDREVLALSQLRFCSGETGENIEGVRSFFLPVSLFFLWPFQVVCAKTYALARSGIKVLAEGREPLEPGGTTALVAADS